LNFASYWKEIAVVLAAVFAIAGTVFDVKDKASHRITIWGRLFFGLTILSMIGGFYAQWEENTREVSRNKQSQDDMLKLIENTNKNVYDISRVLQPLGKSDISLLFRPNCMEVKEFCDTALTKAKSERYADNVALFSMPEVDWEKWPDKTGELISVSLFKDRSKAQAYLEGNCTDCREDILFDVPFYVGAGSSEQNRSVTAFYDVKSKQLFIVDNTKGVSPEVNSEKILSIVDLPGSTLIIRASGIIFKVLMLDSLTFRTDRGQTVDIEHPTKLNVKNETIFEYVFPDFMQH
jgi:hypothetical protein